MKIGIVDYGMGNIKSLIGALNHLGYNKINYTNNEKELNDSDKLILPGVGAFNNAMREIQKFDLNQKISYLTLEKKKPILGICLGMQLLTNQSTENGLNKGLKLVDANVIRFKNKSQKVPHVGFNQVIKPRKSLLFNGIKDKPDFYFCHSYHVMTNVNLNQSFCNYGIDFVSSFEYKNFAGVQFHPELSQGNGLKLLQNFLSKFQC